MEIQEKKKYLKLAEKAINSQNTSDNVKKSFLQQIDKDYSGMKEPFNDGIIEVIWEAFDHIEKDDIVNQLDYSIEQLKKARHAIENY